MPATMRTSEVLTDTKWEKRHSLMDDPREGISTEFESQYDPLWDQCLDALMDLLNRSGRPEENEPSRDAIRLTGELLVRFRKAMPYSPPTLLTREPCGGLIAEWESTDSQSDEYLRKFELTVYNDGHAESTIFENGKIIEILESKTLYEE